MKSFVIVGGGTAGLISALVIRKAFPLYPITLIESSEIGIIGVGEGSTEHWSQFCEYVGIDKRELVRETDGALKRGIKFENWNGDGKNYFHAIGDPFWRTSEDYLLEKTCIDKGIPLRDITLDTDLIRMDGGINTTFQYHFNTFKLNEYLHKKCEERNIDIFKTTLTNVEMHDDGDIKSVIDENGISFSADFFIDSTGFKRFLSSKVGSKWISYKKYLPMNHAIAFPTEDTTTLDPFTTSRALSSGWNWRISTRGRYGNGYVFCDDFINSTQAHDEVQSFYSEKVNVAKDIKFEAGRVDNFWINNCLSIGLSASFVEPLEASSIGNSILQALGFVQSFEYWLIDRKISKTYNSDFIESFDNIVDFIQLHYMTKRNDSEFWKTVQHNITKTDFIQEHLETFKKVVPTRQCFGGRWTMFSVANWIQVIDGLELFDARYIGNNFMESHGEKVAQEQMQLYNNYLVEYGKLPLIDHKTLLEQNRYVLKFE